jgi:hypothetical protein
VQLDAPAVELCFVQPPGTARRVGAQHGGWLVRQTRVCAKGNETPHKAYHPADHTIGRAAILSCGPRSLLPATAVGSTMRDIIECQGEFDAR